MKNLFTLIICLCTLTALAQNKNFIDQPYIETTAEVDTLITPDEIYLNILINEKDTKDKKSLEEQESKMEKSLQKLGINTQENLKLNDLASNFKKYFLKDTDVLKSKVYTLKVSNAQMAGKVIITLEQLEISNVTLDHTAYSKMDDLQLILKSKAILRAKSQAEHFVHPLNQKLGAAIHIMDQSQNMPIYGMANESYKMQARGVSNMADNKYEAADISFEKIKVESRVTVYFKIE